MKTIIYLLCLVAAFLGGKYIAMPFMLLVTKTAGSHATIFFILNKIILLFASIIPLLVLFRVLVFIKSRSFSPPETFKGFIYIYSAIVIIPGILVVVGYYYLGFVQKTMGLSGMPLAYTLFGTSILLSIPVLVCEIREFYQCIPGKKP
jgi:hypothetical protein